jgi:hypothetical protein
MPLQHEGPVERRGPDFYFKQAAKDAASDDEDEDEDVKPAGPFDPTEPGPSGPRWGDGDGGSGPSAGGSGSGGPSGSSSADAGRSSSGTAEGKKRDYGGAPSSGRPSAGKKRAMGPSDGADATTPGDSSMPAGLVAAESTSPSSAFTGGLRMGRSISATGPVPLVERRKLRAALVQRHRTSDVGPSTQGSAYAQQHQLHHGAFYTSSSSAEFAMPDSRPPTAPAAQSYIGLHDEPMFGAHARHHTYPHHGQQQQQQQGTFSPPRFAYSTPDSLSSSGHPSSTSASVSAPETRPQTMAGGEVFHHPQQQSHSYMHLAVSGSGSHAHSHARASASLPGSLGGHWPTRDARPEGQQQQGQLNYPASAPLDAPYTSRAGTHMSGSSWEQARYAEQQQQQQHQQQLPHQAVLRQYPQYTAYARGLVQQEQERQMQQHQQPQMHSSGLAQQHSGSIEMQEQEQIDAGRARTLGHYEASRSAAAYRVSIRPDSDPAAAMLTSSFSGTAQSARAIPIPRRALGLWKHAGARRCSAFLRRQCRRHARRSIRREVELSAARTIGPLLQLHLLLQRSWRLGRRHHAILLPRQRRRCAHDVDYARHEQRRARRPHRLGALAHHRLGTLACGRRSCRTDCRAAG